MKTINLRDVNDCEGRHQYDGNFTLTFTNNEKRVVLHLERFFLEGIVQEVIRILKEEKATVAGIEDNIKDAIAAL